MKQFDITNRKCPDDYVCDSCHEFKGREHIQAWKNNYPINFADSIYDDRYIFCFDCYSRVAQLVESI